MQLEPDEIRSYQQDSFFNQNTKKPNEVNPFTIFLSVLAAILFAWFIREAYIEWQVKQALSFFDQAMQLEKNNPKEIWSKSISS